LCRSDSGEAPKEGLPTAGVALPVDLAGGANPFGQRLVPDLVATILEAEVGHSSALRSRGGPAQPKPKTRAPEDPPAPLPEPSAFAPTGIRNRARETTSNAAADPAYSEKYTFSGFLIDLVFSAE
jgi:hypothetical protein